MFELCSYALCIADPAGAMSWFANLTHMIGPIIGVGLAGSPSHHVPRFQTIAAISSAEIIAKLALPNLQAQLHRQQARRAERTAPEDTITPKKLNASDHMTATCGGSLWV
jgi:hypothetical protein